MELKVCVGSACHLKGAGEVVKTFQSLIQQHNLGEKVKLKGSFCMGTCENGKIAVEFNKKIHSTSADEAERFFSEHVLPKFKTAAKTKA